MREKQFSSGVSEYDMTHKSKQVCECFMTHVRKVDSTNESVTVFPDGNDSVNESDSEYGMAHGRNGDSVNESVTVFPDGKNDSVNESGSEYVYDSLEKQ